MPPFECGIGSCESREGESMIFGKSGRYLKSRGFMPGTIPAHKRIIFALIIFSFFTSLYAQDSQTWYIGKPIADFSFIGLKNVSINDLKPIVKDYIGKNFTMDLFYEVQDKLYGLEKFETITSEAIEFDASRTTVLVKFTVKEKPIISAIQVEGNNGISKSDILDKAVIKKGNFINEAQIKIDEEAIKQLYLDKGFNEITVSSRTEKNETDGTVIVYFTVAEGYKTSIREIKFVGNQFAEANTLRGELKSKQQDFFNQGTYQENRITEDKDAVEKYYRKYGFIKAKVDKIDKNIEKDEEKLRTYLTLVFYITEGDQYTFGDVTFEGNIIFSTDKLKSYIKQQPGKFFNKIQWDSDFQAIQSLYYDSGYISNRFVQDEKIDDVNKQISYSIKIAEHDRAHIENIIITGNVKTKSYVINRELPFEAGDIFSADKIRKGIYNLYNLQYFSNINAQPSQGSAEGLMDLIITVEEQSMADLKFGLAFSGTEFPVSLQFGWSDKNFLGLGLTFGVDVEASLLKQGLAVNYQDNYLFGKNFGGGLSFSFYHSFFQNAQQDNIAKLFFDEDVPDPFDSKEKYQEAIRNGTATEQYNLMEYDSYDFQLGGNLSYFIPTSFGKIGAAPSLTAKSSFVWYDESKYRPYLKAVRDNLDRWSFIYTMGITFYLDNRDIFYNPENGYLLSQYFGLTGSIPAGDRQYVTLKSRAEGFLTLFKIPVSESFDFQTVLALHAGFSWILPPPTENKILATDADLLYIDGMNTGRGWSPIWDGEVMLDFAAELRHPLVRQLLWFTWFFDAVAMLNDWQTLGTLTGDDFYMSFGFGLRVTMSGLPIRVYLAQAFKSTNGQIEFEKGGIPLFDPLNLKFVVSVTQPGGF
jgi:outer membrane protein insertion porin family